MSNKLRCRRPLDRCIPGIAVTVTVALLTACSPKTEKPAPTSLGGVTLTAAQRGHVQVYAVEPTIFHKTVVADGVVGFDNDQATSVIAPFSGPVTRLLVPLGQQVRKGQALAVVDSSDFAAAVGTYRKTLAAARAARRLADLDKDLLAHQGVSRREEEQAESDAVGAEADRDAALQALVALDVDPQTIKNIQAGRPVSRLQGMIRSPIAGTLVEKLITPGQLLSAGTTPCFTVADLSRVWVMAQVFGSDVASVSRGDTAEIETGISKDIGGTVDNVSAVVNPDTRSVAVRIVADNPADLLKKQMYVRVQIRSAQRDKGLLVPSSAVLRDDVNLPFVYLLESDGSFARRQVTLGYRDGDRYDITSGLKSGERIVSNGALFLQFMQNQ
ncbi:MAG: efflux RND transporter periplasmic adaptor subunit [Alphaproteobacteria bacterium]|nr:efflux RND transporter periplasmic adaptor subunit [Alphaproteobacteria bacterium]MDE2112001.1 efflux RND transporter periplasmic adaptor subunit [Alphaproteobacteria bacterium]MDE2492341.1 efflux RND transporter periplasmic adaptor subunit [Alphaproteobacteria bacterium]